MKKLKTFLVLLSLMLLADYLFYKLKLLTLNSIAYDMLFFITMTVLLFLLLTALFYNSLYNFKSSKLKIALYISFSLVLAMFAADRWMVINKFYHYSKTLRKANSGNLWKSDPQLAHKGIANANGYYAYYIGDSISGTVNVAFDSLGFRTASDTNKLSFDGLNLFLGCSFTFGDYIRAEEGYPYQTSKLLENNFINAGASGYGIGQMKQLLDTLLPKYQFRYVFIQLSPWLAHRALKLNGPTYYGYAPFPYFSYDDGTFNLNFPAYKTRKYKRKNWREGTLSYFEKIRFTFSDGFNIEVLDFLSCKFALLKMEAGFMPSPAKAGRKLEKYFYSYAIKKCEEYGATPIVLKLAYPAAKSADIVNFLNPKCMLIDLDNALDSVVSKTGKSHEKLFRIYHVHKGERIYFDGHPNAYANDIMSQAIFNKLKTK
ncbi:MAG: hypothetical protein L3J31_01175 [Bacteroidales bacterium]|nr:hypothetical protein [Bacteroidales bacterium]MCF6341401.1 hypothetical protein [Bacteroidales bacterium]